MILIEDSAEELENRKKLTKWTDDFTDARDWLVRELDACRWGTVCRGHFRSRAKQIRIKDERRLDAISAFGISQIEALLAQ